jgi:phosphatidylinositol alpha-mannosyltransferase
MKIGLVCPYNLFRGGGVQECVLALREGIVKRGHEAYIITPQPNKHNGHVIDGTIMVGGARAFRAARTMADISVSVDTDKLDEMLKREEFDVLHFHEPWIPMLSLQILLRSDAINIATFHAAMSERRTSRTVERVITPYTKSILRYIDHMTAVSPTATNYVRTLTRQKQTIIPNGIDLSKYSADKQMRRVPTRKKTILYIGRLEKRKGVLHLLHAFAKIRQLHPEFELVIAGDGPDRKKLETYVEEQYMRGVHFLGYVDESVKLKLLSQADIFCSPALYGESFGIVLLEAMASGCVTIAGNNSGYENVLKGRGQLSVVNPKDTDEFARRIVLLSNDEQLRKAWQEWAVEEVKQYDYNLIIDQYVSLYEAAYAKKYA